MVYHAACKGEYDIGLLNRSDSQLTYLKQCYKNMHAVSLVELER